MGEEFNPSKPIYLQLIERISHQIVRKELSAGEKLPSVREMAISSGVNPNTVQRTYSELERMGIVETRRGQGTFVTEEENILSSLRENLKEKQVIQFINDMREMGYSDREMVEGLQEYLQKEGDTKHD
ncbi:GntR family transcriptional regulator [Ammoniphilus resinae]|uniref:GntR family transcriptional regulator n=1 Tax=Ammoniphilus resinae TaxID=861532 RepID=A0ABS4GQ22_9BACL|nr:GntR family transcriptional regulator [Ammoniphilus resinae]MBP1932373.1 GntR family transcriptional regulator [Ammoniphilus resinae]